MLQAFHSAWPSGPLIAPVGIGTDTPRGTLHINGVIVSDGAGDVLASNAYFSGGWRYLSANPAWMLAGAAGTGTAVRLLTATSGATDASITWRTSLAVDSTNGFVGIGRVPAVRLDVGGTIASTLSSTGIWMNFSDSTTHNFQLGGDAQYVYWNTTTSSGFRFSCGNTERFRIMPDGTLTHRANATVIVDSSSHLGLRSYTLATLPSAATAARLIHVSNGSSNRALAISDGSAWRWPDGTLAA